MPARTPLKVHEGWKCFLIVGHKTVKVYKRKGAPDTVMAHPGMKICRTPIDLSEFELVETLTPQVDREKRVREHKRRK